MPRQGWVVGVIAAAGILAVPAAFEARADAFAIDLDALNTEGCIGDPTCPLDEALLSIPTGGVLQSKSLNGASGFGVSGGASGPEIDRNQTLRVDFDQARDIVAIRILFLFNGPEFSDRAEKAQIMADGTAYTLSVNSNPDVADAVWSGPGTVTRTATPCGPTTAAGTGCFFITDPFPGAVSRLDFTALAGGTPFAGAGTNDSDYSIELIDVGAEVVVDLAGACAEASGCPVDAAEGKVAASLNFVNVTNPVGSTETIVIPLRVPDCRYIPRVCLDLLPPGGDTPSTDSSARSRLIALGVIKSLDPSGPNKLNPAAQELNIKSLLPPDVISHFDTSGMAPTGLPALYVSSRWRGQFINDFWINGLFFVTETGVQFRDTFEGLIDVSQMTGQELGCFTDLDDLYAWDMMASVSERARSISGRHVDRLINVGCENPTKVSGERLSAYFVNFEIVRDTFASTIHSTKPKLTVNNDAVFARLVELLWKHQGEILANFACKLADPAPSGSGPPLTKPVCFQLLYLWGRADSKIKHCVRTAFDSASAFRTLTCNAARDFVDEFGAALPASPTGSDRYNRLAEMGARVEAFLHVWDERFLNSLKPGGFCREKGTCPP